MHKSFSEQENLMILVKNVSKKFTLNKNYSAKDSIIKTILRKRNNFNNSFTAINNVSYTIEKGESVALLGSNGSGKSTFLKLISGVMLPDSGRIYTRGRVAGLIEVGAGFHHDLTGRENIYLNASILGMSIDDTNKKIKDIIAFSDIENFIDIEVKFYSSGMFLRLAFAVAVHVDPDIFLIDEILAVGDEHFQKKCKEKIIQLKESRKTLLVVSHDFHMIKQICDRGIVISKGKKVYDGPIIEAINVIKCNKM